MLFLKRFWEPIARGEITVTFRRWKAQQVLAGRRYRTAAGIIQIESVSLWAEDNITDIDAQQAGHADARSLLADLPVRPGLPLYRIQFHVVDDPDPRAAPTRPGLTARAVDYPSSRNDRDLPWQEGARSRCSFRAGDPTVQDRCPQVEEPRSHLEPQDRISALSSR